MRQGKKIVVWAVAIMMVANSASAFRWRHGGHCQPVYCGPVYDSGCYESSCGPADCGVVYEESGCSMSMPADCSGCEVTTDKVPSAPIESTEPSTPQPSLDDDMPPAPPEPAQVEPAPAPTDTFTPAPAPVEPAPAKPAPTPITPPATTPIPAPAPAAATPAPATPAPAAEVEDLFSQPETTPVEPQTKPAEPAEVEDLFKEPETTPAKPSDEVDDLFKDLDAPSGNKAAASDTPAMPAEPSKEVEDLFSEPAGPMAAAQPKTDGMRLWTDNTGEFQVRARLIVVGKTHVRLLKETGKFTTVPYSRLSQTDLAFVRTQTDASKVAGF